ncbi:MAG: hypothetical protein AAF268_04570 [Cyanobacteria bacterium P01_A01_bin.3]
MSGLLIADTVPLIAGSSGAVSSAPTHLLKGLSTYLERVQQRSLQSLALSQDLADVDWGKAWQDYAQLLKQASGEVVTIAYPGSLGDAIDDHSTLANLCQDWRLSVLLTLPPLPYAISVAAAFAALATSSKAPLVGYVLVGDSATLDESGVDIATLSQHVEAIARVPVLGHLPNTMGSQEDNALFAAAAALNWELLPW